MRSRIVAAKGDPVRFFFSLGVLSQLKSSVVFPFVSELAIVTRTALNTGGVAKKSRFLSVVANMKDFTSFDGTRIAYHDEGEGLDVILLHGFGVDGLGQFGEFERVFTCAESHCATAPVVTRGITFRAQKLGLFDPGVQGRFEGIC